MDNYYLYRHIRLDKNEVFYVGIGKKNINKKSYLYHCEYYRAFRPRYSKHQKSHNKYWTNIANKTYYKVDIILESNDENYIKQKEIEFIKIYGRKDLGKGTLVNHTDGGDGTLNPSQESIKKRARYGKDNSISVPVYQYNLQGNFIQKFDSIRLAAESIKSYHAGITKCCMNQIHYYKNSQWFYEYQGKNIKNISCLNGGRNQRKVIRIDILTNEEKLYSSLKSAAQDNNLKGHTGISSCCRGKVMTAAGYKWKYLNNDDIISNN